MQTIKDFLKFIVHPYSTKPINNINEKYIFILKSYGILFMLFVPIVIIKLAYIHFSNDTNNIIVTQNYKAGISSIFNTLGRSYALLYACFIGPLIEESGFRLGFSFKKRDVMISILVLTIILSLHIESLFFACIIGVSLLSLTTYCFIKHIQQSQLTFIKNKYEKSLSHIMVLLFSIIHLSNYSPLNKSYIIIYAFNILLITIASYMFLYIRIRAGFSYVVVFHGLLNAFMLRII